MRLWYNTDFTYANPIEEIQSNEYSWNTLGIEMNMLETEQSNQCFCGFHLKCF